MRHVRWIAGFVGDRTILPVLDSQDVLVGVVTVDDVLANTGWKLKVADDVKPTPEPNAAELKAIREYDTKGFWTS